MIAFPPASPTSPLSPPLSPHQALRTAPETHRSAAPATASAPWSAATSSKSSAAAGPPCWCSQARKTPSPPPASQQRQWSARGCMAGSWCSPAVATSHTRSGQGCSLIFWQRFWNRCDVSSATLISISLLCNMTAFEAHVQASWNIRWHCSMGRRMFTQ
jgi:hypothetical protein